MFGNVKKGAVLVLCLCISMLGFGPVLAEEDMLFQVSTLNALMLGLYDGVITVDAFLAYGDTGLGTMNHLDGEMIVLDGVVYQVKVDGTVVPAPGDQTIPFGIITAFEADATVTLSEKVTDIKALTAYLDGLDTVAENPNRMYVLKLNGHFDTITMRTVPAQEKPYPPLADVTPDQSVFDHTDIDGTLVGVYYPEYLASVNMSGWHLHFLSTDLTKGGHVLAMEGVTGEIELDAIDQFMLVLPDTEDFASADLAGDMAEAISSVEN